MACFSYLSKSGRNRWEICWNRESEGTLHSATKILKLPLTVIPRYIFESYPVIHWIFQSVGYFLDGFIVCFNPAYSFYIHRFIDCMFCSLRQEFQTLCFHFCKLVTEHIGFLRKWYIILAWFHALCRRVVPNMHKH